MDISTVNSRLRQAGVKVTILQRKNWLYLRAVLPPKPGSNKAKPYRQEVTRSKAGLPATSQGLKAAEKLAVSLWGSVIDNSFEWDYWLGKTTREQRLIKEWVSDFREIWLSKGKTSAATWKRDWQRAFNRLPQDQPLTCDVLLNTLLQTKTGTRERKRTTACFNRLAEYAELPIDLSPYKGNYSTGRSEAPRDVPSDELIIEWQTKIPNPYWRWIYGVIASLGIRPHEAFFLKQTADPLIWDVTDGKTGPRQTSALYPEWIDDWKLLDGNLPNLTYPEFQQYGDRTSHQFNRYEVPFVPYDLRHAFAVRCIKFDIPVTIAAKMMGHSVYVHTKTYHRWLSAAEQQAAYHRAISNGPRPPSVSLADV